MDRAGKSVEGWELRRRLSALKSQDVFRSANCHESCAGSLYFVREMIVKTENICFFCRRGR